MKYNDQVNGSVGTAAGAILAITYYPENDTEDEFLWSWAEKKIVGVKMYYAPNYDGETWGRHGLMVDVDFIDNRGGVPTRAGRNPAAGQIAAAITAAAFPMNRIDRPGSGRWLPWNL